MDGWRLMWACLSIGLYPIMSLCHLRTSAFGVTLDCTWWSCICPLCHSLRGAVPQPDTALSQQGKHTLMQSCALLLFIITGAVFGIPSCWYSSLLTLRQWKPMLCWNQIYARRKWINSVWRRMTKEGPHNVNNHRISKGCSLTLSVFLQFTVGKYSMAWNVFETHTLTLFIIRQTV